MTDLTVRLEILAYSAIENARPHRRMAISCGSILLLDQRYLSIFYLDSGKTKDPPTKIRKFLNNSLLITLSDNGCFVGGMTSDGNVFLWDKDNNIERIINGLPLLASFHERKFLSDPGLSLPYLCIGDTGFHLLVVDFNFQVYVWQADDINKNYRAFGSDKKQLGKADHRGVLTGGWSMVSQPPDVKMPTPGDHGSCVNSIFVHNSGTYGFHCLCSVVFYDSNTEIMVLTLVLQFDDKKSYSHGMPRFDAYWKKQSHPMTAILTTDKPTVIKETGALLVKHSRDGQLIAVALNREPHLIHIIFLSPHHSILLGRTELQINSVAGSQRQHWVVNMEWMPDDLHLVCFTGHGSAHLISRLGGVVACVTEGFNNNPCTSLTLHPVVSSRTSAEALQKFSMAVHPNRPVFLCSDGRSILAVQVMSRHTCLSLMRDVSASANSLFLVAETKFSIKPGRNAEMMDHYKVGRRLLGGNIPNEPLPRSEVAKQVYKFETTPKELSNRPNTPASAKNKNVRVDQGGSTRGRGEDMKLNNLNEYLYILEDRCAQGWRLASSHSGLWTVEHELVVQEITFHLVRLMQLMMTQGNNIAMPPSTSQISSPSSSMKGRDRAMHPLTNVDRKFNPGLARAIVLLEKLLQVLEINCSNVDETKNGCNKNASAGSLINSALLLVHWFVLGVLSTPSKRSKVHALYGCYKIIDMAERNLTKMFVCSNEFCSTNVVKAKLYLIFSDKSNLMPKIEEEEDEKQDEPITQSLIGGVESADPMSEGRADDATNQELSEPPTDSSIAKSSLGVLASLAKKKKGSKDTMESLLLRRMSSVLPSSDLPSLTITSRNVLACISLRLCASYRLVYKHACRHLEMLTNECEGRNPDAVNKQLIGTKRVMSLLVCKMEEMRSHMVPNCVDRFAAIPERRYLDYEQTAAIHAWLTELLELKDGFNPGRACRILHAILYTHLARYDVFGAIQLVDKVVRNIEVKQICFCSGLDQVANTDEVDFSAYDDERGGGDGDTKGDDNDIGNVGDSDITHDDIDVNRPDGIDVNNNLNGTKRSRNAERKKQLRQLQQDVLDLFWLKVPFTNINSSNENAGIMSQPTYRPMKMFLYLSSKRLFQTMGRFMARYFVGGCEPFVHPPHQPYALPPLFDDVETVDKHRRLIPIQRQLLTKAITLQDLERVWSPERTLQYLLVSGLLPDAMWYLNNIGNPRAAISVAVVVEHRRGVIKSERNIFKLSLPRCLRTRILFEEMFEEIIKNCLRSDWWLEDSSRLQSYFGSIFLASAMSKVDVLSPVAKRMMNAMLRLVVNEPIGSKDDVPGWMDGMKQDEHIFAHPLVNVDVKSPLPSVYYPQPSLSSMDESRLSSPLLRELRARLLLHRIFSLLRVSLSSAGCLKLCVAKYCKVVVDLSSDADLKASSSSSSSPASSELLRPYLEKYKEDSRHPAPSTSESTDLLSYFRDLCSLAWLMNVRDELFAIIKEKQKIECKQMQRSDGNIQDWFSVCKECVRSCMEMMPFCHLLNCTPQLHSILLSSLFELPNTEETASLVARCFPSPEILDPDTRSRLQLKLKEWETAFVQSKRSNENGTTMAALYVRHCDVHSRSDVKRNPSHSVLFPNLRSSVHRPVGKYNTMDGTDGGGRQDDVGSEPRGFESSQNYVKFLANFFEILLSNETNETTNSHLPIVPENFIEIRRNEFNLLDERGRPQFLEGDFVDNNKTSSRPTVNFNGRLFGDHGEKLHQRKSLLNLSKFIGNRPSRNRNKNNNNNNNINNNNDNDDDNDNYNNNAQDAERRESLSNLPVNTKSFEYPKKPKVDFSNKPYLPEEPGKEMKLNSYCIQPAVFESMNFGPNYQETEKLADWFSYWSNEIDPIAGRVNKEAAMIGGGDKPSSTALKIPIQSKLLVYSVWSAERGEIYERMRTEVTLVPMETQVTEEDLTKEDVKRVEEDFEIKDVSMQSNVGAEIPKRMPDKLDCYDQVQSDVEGEEEERVARVDHVGSSKKPTSVNLMQTDVSMAERTATTVDMIQITIRDEMRRILEAQNHGILSVLEYLKTSPADHQQELDDLLSVLQYRPSSSPPTPSRTNQYSVYAVTVETDGNRYEPKGYDSIGDDLEDAKKQSLEIESIFEDQRGINIKLDDLNVDKIKDTVMNNRDDKDDDDDDNFNNNNILNTTTTTTTNNNNNNNNNINNNNNSNTSNYKNNDNNVNNNSNRTDSQDDDDDDNSKDQNGINNDNSNNNTNNYKNDNNDNNNTKTTPPVINDDDILRVNLPPIKDILSELKELVGTNGRIAGVGKLLRLPGVNNHGLQSSIIERRRQSLISSAESTYIKSSPGQEVVRNPAFSDNFRFPVKLSRQENPSILKHHGFMIYSNTNDNSNKDNHNINNNIDDTTPRRAPKNEFDSDNKSGIGNPAPFKFLSFDTPRQKPTKSSEDGRTPFLRASRAAQKQLLLLQQQTDYDGASRKQSKASKQQKPPDVSLRSCLKHLPASHDDPIFDSLKRLIHRQVQEHEQQKQLHQRPPTQQKQQDLSSTQQRDDSMKSARQRHSSCMQQQDKSEKLNQEQEQQSPKDLTSDKTLDYSQIQRFAADQTKDPLEISKTVHHGNCLTLEKLRRESIFGPIDPREESDLSWWNADQRTEKLTNAKLQYLLTRCGPPPAPLCDSLPRPYPREAEEAKNQLEMCRKKLESAKNEVNVLKNVLHQEIQRLKVKMPDESSNFAPFEVANPHQLVIPENVNENQHLPDVKMPKLEVAKHFDQYGCPRLNLISNQRLGYKNPKVSSRLEAPGKGVELASYPVLSRPMQEAIPVQEDIGEFEGPIDLMDEGFERQSISINLTPQVDPFDLADPREADDLLIYRDHHVQDVDRETHNHGAQAAIDVMDDVADDFNFSNNLLSNDVVTGDVDNKDTLIDDIPISERCLKKYKFIGEKVMNDIDTKVHNIEKMASNMEREFCSVRLMQNRPKSAGVESMKQKTSHDVSLPSTSQESKVTMAFRKYLPKTLDYEVARFDDDKSPEPKHFSNMTIATSRTTLTSIKTTSISSNTTTAATYSNKESSTGNNKATTSTNNDKSTSSKNKTTLTLTLTPRFFFRKNFDDVEEQMAACFHGNANNFLDDRPPSGWRKRVESGQMCEEEREAKKRMRTMRNMEERCKMAKDLIEDLENVSDICKGRRRRQSVESCPRIPRQAYVLDRASWMKRTELKPHPPSTYIERLQKVNRQPRNRWIPHKIYGYKSPADRFTIRRKVNDQITMNGNRYDVTIPSNSAVDHRNFNNNITDDIGQSNVGLQKLQNDLHGNHYLGSPTASSVDYRELVTIDDLLSVDGSAMSEHIDWNQIDRLMEEEEEVKSC